MKTIKFVITHSSAHFEEYLTTFLFYLYGRNKGYDIISDFSFKENSIGSIATDKSFKDWINSGHLPIGTLGGDLDEHANSTGDRKDKSAVIMAAKILFPNGPSSTHLKDLIRFTSNEDQKAGSGPQSLPYITKTLSASGIMTPMEVFCWLKEFFLAEDLVKKDGIKIARNSFFLRGLVKRYKKENSNANLQQLSYFLYNKKLADPASNIKIYNLSVVVNILKASGKTKDEVYDWLKVFLDIEYHRQDVIWPKTIEETKNPDNLSVVRADKGPKVAFFNSDSNVAHMAARKETKADLVVVFRSNGHVQMFASTKYYGGPSVVYTGDLVAELRKAEGDTIEDSSDWTTESLKGSPWYYHKAAQSILNGSHSAPHVPATSLDKKVIKNLVARFVLRMRPNNKRKVIQKPIVSAAPALGNIKVDGKGVVRKAS